MPVPVRILREPVEGNPNEIVQILIGLRHVGARVNARTTPHRYCKLLPIRRETELHRVGVRILTLAQDSACLMTRSRRC